MSTLSRTIDILRALVAFPTVSSDSNRALIDHCADLLATCGARVETFTSACGTKANLWATLGPETNGGLVLSGHTDVVPVTGQDWSTDPFDLCERNGALYGRGTCDMKGFIACTLALAETWALAPLSRPLHFCLTYDEEVGCLGARALLPELARRQILPAMALIGEPTEMQVIDGHKGCCEYTVHFKGRAGHGSDPDKGANAVDAAVRYAAALQSLADQLKSRAPVHSRFIPPWTSVNIGRLQGGSTHNVIPDHATLDWEMRPVQDSDRTLVLEALDRLVSEDLLPSLRRAAPDAAITTDVIGEVAGLVPMPDNAARDLMLALTGANIAEVVPFGTEAGLFQKMGLSVVVCGPGSIEQAHKPDEFVTHKQLGLCLETLKALTPRLMA